MRRRFSKTKDAKRRAREFMGQPPGTKVIPDKRRKPPKHKERYETSN